MVAFLTHGTYRYFSEIGYTLAERVQYAPFAYRLNWQIVSFLNGAPFSVLTWMSISWIASIILVYIILRPKGSQLLLFICWFAAVCYFGTIYDGEALVLIALLARYMDNKYTPLLLVPIALFREIVAFTGLLFLFFYTNKKIEGFLSFIAGGALYGVVRFIVIGNKPYAAFDFFTMPFLLDFLMNPAYVFTYILLIVALIFFTINTQYKWMWLFSAIPFFMFALFWEPQLWFPLVLIQLGVSRYKETGNPIEKGENQTNSHQSQNRKVAHLEEN